MPVTTPIETPYTILVDTREQNPFEFTDIRDTDGQPIYVYQDRAGLKSGDYSLLGMENQVAIERKSHSDLLGSVTAGRKRFQREIERLNEMEHASVVIEADWHELMCSSHKYSAANPIMISRTIVSWSIRYPKVHWWPCHGRRHAELMTFRLLDRYWELKAEKEIA